MTDGFDTYIDLQSGEVIDKNDIKVLSRFNDLISCNSEYISSLDEEQISKISASIDDYNNLGEIFWNLAEENKGHIADFAVRGGSKKTTNRPKSMEEMIKTYKTYWSKIKDCNVTCINDYCPCGPTAAGFVLDYIQANDLQNLTEWMDLHYAENHKGEKFYTNSRCANELFDIMHCFEAPGEQYATDPWQISNGVSRYSNYKLVLSPISIPKAAIDNRLPGVSLRVFGSGFAHYRPVINYKQHGWWIFSWTEMQIWDLYDCYDKTSHTYKPKWETFVPVYHFLCWNTVKK